jgi:hypothetical protein
MPVTEDEKKQYGDFVRANAVALGGLDVKPDQHIWHYTTGSALISIIQSGELYATQVSCLNDSTEVLYASNVLRNAFLNLQPESFSGEEAQLLTEIVKNGLSSTGQLPSHIPSRWFVTCFSHERDDLSQWRAYSGGENGYALGFYAGGFFGRDQRTVVVRVNYDRKLHEGLAAEIGKATLSRFREGLERRIDQRESWTKEFLEVWTSFLSYLEPLVKDPGFRAENEYRIVHELMPDELANIRFKQKQSLMSRYLPLSFGNQSQGTQRLPLAAVIVGPSRHKEISRVSVDTLLRQKGYTSIPIYLSEIPFQST